MTNSFLNQCLVTGLTPVEHTRQAFYFNEVYLKLTGSFWYADQFHNAGIRVKPDGLIC